jgi:hypothetical protein
MTPIPTDEKSISKGLLFSDVVLCKTKCLVSHLDIRLKLFTLVLMVFSGIFLSRLLGTANLDNFSGPIPYPQFFAILVEILSHFALLPPLLFEDH